jgi:hypothetical protein
MGLLDFFWRWLGAAVLVLGTYNPTPYSFVRWVLEDPSELVPLKLLIGVLILIGFVVYVRAAWEALGRMGLILAVLFAAAVIWWLNDAGLLSLDPAQPMLIWAILVAIATIIAIGMSWAIWRRKIAGQTETL